MEGGTKEDAPTPSPDSIGAPRLPRVYEGGQEAPRGWDQIGELAQRLILDLMDAMRYGRVDPRKITSPFED